MDGNLSVSNLYPNNNNGEIGSPSNRWDRIYINQIDALSSNIVVELSGFYVDGDFTVNGTISAVGGNSNQWNSVYSTVQTNSGRYESAYTSLNSNSGRYESTHSSLNSNSGRYGSVYTNVNANSANYILQGGNSFGTGMVVGTNDSQSISVRTNGSQRLLITNTNHRFNGNMSIGTGVDSPERLTIAGNLSASGNSIVVGTGTFNHVQANTKSFFIDHPTLPGKKLQYGSLESPYHGIRLTGQDVLHKGECTVQLPGYISALVREECINIQLTNIKHDKILYVDGVDLKNNTFTVKTGEIS